MSRSDEGIPVFHLDDETKMLFKKTRDQLDEILETFEILEDEELMKEIEIKRNFQFNCRQLSPNCLYLI
jgi:hypothetical protein